MAVDPLDSLDDPFRPPDVPTLVSCLHCGEEYDSYRIEWRVWTCSDGEPRGFWCCPIPGCDGMGFGCDILPVDPNYRDERGGWVHDDAEELDDADADERDIADDSVTDSDFADGSADDENDANPW